MTATGGSGSGAEERLIARHFAPLARHPGALSLTDDAAFLTPPDGCDLVLTKDAIVAGVHFLPDDPAGAVAQKALRVNLSDLAAKGADPLGFLLALALPDDKNDDWLAAFTQGLAADAEHYGCALLGGDTVRSPGPLMASITAIGTLPRGTMVRRSGARPGDRVFVSGTIGDGALGLRLLTKRDAATRWKLAAADAAHLVERYRIPQPRSALAAAVRFHASAAMDVSDGLVGDLAKLCRMSGVSAEIEAARVPLSPAVRAAVAADAEALGVALTGGDDYEILCTVPDAETAAFVAAAATAGVPITEIGRVAAGDGEARVVGADGARMKFAHNAFSHF